MTGCTSDPVGTDPSCLTTDAAKEDASTSQEHTTDPTMAEAPATINGMHPTPHPTTIAAHDTHQLNDALDDTVTEIHHAGTTITHLSHATILVNAT